MATAIKEHRSVLENPAYSLSDPKTWERLFDGTESATGIRVTPTKMLSVAAVHQCVSVISQDVAKLPLDLYRATDAGREKLRDNLSYELVHHSPNEEQTAFDFWQLMLVYKLIWGNAYAWIERDNVGRPLSLMPICPTMIAPKRSGGVLRYALRTEGGNAPPIPAADIIHLRGISLDGIEGLAPLDIARDAIARSIAAASFTSRFFKNGLKIGGFLILPQGMPKPAQDRAEADFRKRTEGEQNSFKAIGLPDGIKFQPNSVTPADAEMSTQREHEVREAARFYNLPPSRLGLSDSVSYNSKAEDNQNYLDSTLSPHLIQISQECRRKLLNDSERSTGLYFEHNTRALVAMNSLQRHQIYALGIRVGIYSPNECRRFENLNDRDGGDIYLTQTNLAGYGQTGSADNIGISLDPDPAAPKNDPANGADPDSKRGVSIPVMQLMFGLGRLARHKAEKPHAFRQWTESRWASFEAEARAAGLPDDFIERLRSQAADLHAKTPPAELATAVNDLATQWEQSCLEAN